jgi:hypothetical protein
MAYPLSASVVQTTYDKLDNDLKQLAARCQAVVNATAGGASAFVYTALNVATAAIAYRTDFAQTAANSALVAQLIPFVQAQKAGATALQVQNEYVALNTLAGNLLTAFAADYPHDAQGRLLDRTFNSTTGEVWLTFTAAQAPNFMPAVTALLAEFS